MFTGLIIELGEVAALERRGPGARLAIKGRKIMRDIAVGDSIAVNGVCLTVTAFEKDCAYFDVSPETLDCSNIGTLKPGDKVNLESSLRPDSKLGGHFVTGHIGTAGKIKSRKAVGDSERIEIEAAPAVLKYITPKGSVAVDGISLTVVDVLRDSFSVVVIPHTVSMTTIGFKKAGDTVNLEPDILAKYVERLLQKDDSGTDATAADERFLSKLKDSGFM
jgi:riboflavin synthase